MSRARILGVTASLALVASWATLCRAEVDGAYGRLAGDLSVQIDLGIAVREDPGVFGSASARYLDTAGIYVAGFEPRALGSDAPSRAASAGIELRPFFLPRLLKNREHGPAWLDLAVDSFALRFGAAIARQPPDMPLAAGLELGAQIGLPLTSHVSGPWLRAGCSLQWPSSGFASRELPNSAALPMASLTLGWQSLLDAGLVDVRDRRPD